MEFFNGEKSIKLSFYENVLFCKCFCGFTNVLNYHRYDKNNMSLFDLIGLSNNDWIICHRCQSKYRLLGGQLIIDRYIDRSKGSPKKQIGFTIS